MPPNQNSMTGPIRVLLIDDDPIQHLILEKFLATAVAPAFRCRIASTLQEGWPRLAAGDVDVLILDLGLPECSGMEAFTQTQTRFPNLPIVVLTGQDDETLGMNLIHAGAQDYLVKGQVSATLLVRTLRYAMERKRLLLELQQALAEIKTLSGMLPICANCKKIRDDQGYWTRIEEYIQERSTAEFTHGICPDCVKILYPDFAHTILPDA
ncbi:MAG: response regulator [bacterium]